MKLKMRLMGISAAAGLALFGGAAGAAFADDPAPIPVPPSVISPLPPAPQPPAGTDGSGQPFYWRWEFAFPWMRLGIIDDAAQVIGMPKEELRDRLREGRSLAEVARNHGVGEERLEDGILSGEWDDLVRQVHEGRLTWEQAGRYYNDLGNHIDEIIHYRR
jgi:hypothetical protein